MKKLIIAMLVSIVGVGCHAQVPPTNHVVNLSWTAAQPSGGWQGCTTSAPCSYIVSRKIVTTGTSSCPAADTTSPNYTPLNDKAPTSALAYTDPTASGASACYVVQTQQGSAISAPSNPSVVFVVPANPLAPVIQSSTVAENGNIGFPKPTSNFSYSPGGLTGVIASK